MRSRILSGKGARRRGRGDPRHRPQAEGHAPHDAAGGPVPGVPSRRGRGEGGVPLRPRRQGAPRRCARLHPAGGHAWRHHEDHLRASFEAGALSGDGVAAHVALLGEILDATVPTLGVAEVAKTHDETRRASRVVGALVGIGALVLGARLAASRFRRAECGGRRSASTPGRPPPRPRKRRAASPRSGFSSPRNARAGGRSRTAREWSTLAYGDRAVTAGRTTCAACGERRVRYFQGALPE